MRIGELAAATGVSVRSLRYYEEQRLLSADRSSSGQRVYPESAVARVVLIQQLFTAGLCSSTMVDILPCMSEPAARTSLLREQLEQERVRITRDVESMLHTQAAMDQIIRELDSAAP